MSVNLCRSVYDDLQKKKIPPVACVEEVSAYTVSIGNTRCVIARGSTLRAYTRNSWLRCDTVVGFWEERDNLLRSVERDQRINC